MSVIREKDYQIIIYLSDYEKIKKQNDILAQAFLDKATIVKQSDALTSMNYHNYEYLVVSETDIIQKLSEEIAYLKKDRAIYIGAKINNDCILNSKWQLVQRFFYLLFN